jgi:hypothetical protein
MEEIIRDLKIWDSAQKSCNWELFRDSAGLNGLRQVEHDADAAADFHTFLKMFSISFRTLLPKKRLFAELTRNIASGRYRTINWCCLCKMTMQLNLLVVMIYGNGM